MESVTRRSVLTAAAAAPLAAQVRRAALGDRIRLGVIGVGPRGRYVLDHFMREPDVQVMAVADCFAERREAAKVFVDAKQGNRDCAVYRRHEEVLERQDIDAVLIATGDRWHAVLSALAARAGKDVYCEKPVTLCIAEGRALAKVLAEQKTVWQCGTQRRSIPGYAFVRKVVQEGRIGKLHTITCSMGDGPWRRDALAVPAAAPPVEVFDYERWLGQAPSAPYSEDRVRLWRVDWDMSGGPIADMGPHYFEFAQWVLTPDGAPAAAVPYEFSGEGAFMQKPKHNVTPYFVDVLARYKSGVRMRIDSGPKGTRFDGDAGWIRLADEGVVSADPAGVLQGLQVPESNWKVMSPHIRDFLDAMRSRKATVSGMESTQRAHSILHCANLSLRLGRTLYYDGEAEMFEGDAQANNTLAREMRAPWRI